MKGHQAGETNVGDRQENRIGMAESGKWATMEGPKAPSEARRRKAPEQRRGGVW